MAQNSNKKIPLKKKLTYKYRMVVLNEDTFEEKVSFKLSRLNVYVLGGLISILLVVSTTLLISTTSLREYIPGYTSVKLKRQTADLLLKIDSLEQVMIVNEQYISNVKDALTGDVSTFEFDVDSVLENYRNDFDSEALEASQADSLFRLEVERLDQFSFFDEAQKDVNVVFFSPISGTITAPYNIDEKHFAVDVAVETGTPVKAVADGTVIFAEWTAATGHVIILEHTQGFISVYKHNGALHKNQGDLVKSGEVIASSGSSGELTTGPHLHFELWSDGYPVDPLNFIDFE